MSQNCTQKQPSRQLMGLAFARGEAAEVLVARLFYGERSEHLWDGNLEVYTIVQGEVASNGVR